MVHISQECSTSIVRRAHHEKPPVHLCVHQRGTSAMVKLVQIEFAKSTRTGCHWAELSAACESAPQTCTECSPYFTKARASSASDSRVSVKPHAAATSIVRKPAFANLRSLPRVSVKPAFANLQNKSCRGGSRAMTATTSVAFPFPRTYAGDRAEQI